MAKVVLPFALTRLFPGAPRQLELDVATVGAAIDGLEAQWPGMHDRLCASRTEIRRHLEIFVDGERSKLDTEVGPHSEIVILLAISGG